MGIKIVRMLGGLANRMFQYTYCEYLKEKGYVACVDNYYPGKLKHEIFDWNRVFPNAPLTKPSKSKIWMYGGGYDMVSKIRRKLGLTYKFYMAPSAFNIPTDEEIRQSDYFAGVFQHAQPASMLKNRMAELFRFSPFEDERNIALQKEMEECESVAVHIRKGEDYLIRESYENTCTADYYKATIRHIKKNYPNAVFYLFTDNIEWVKNNIPDIKSIGKLIDWNPSVGWGNHFDMQLMTCAKHNIIANSTYSWWGAFLNPNPNKIVIGPQKWFSEKSPSFKYNSDTLLPNWLSY